ncbi:MAG: HD domain-containing protein, partial [Candidatus Methanofastidiosum sp.]|nr:HD domain-containing protein [Methanofastidiosum sp.]
MEVVAWHCLDTNQNRKNCEILRSSSINFYLGISDSSIIPQVIESQSIEKAYNYLKKTEIYSLIKAVICEKVKISQENLPYIVKLAKDGYAYFWDMEDLFWFLKFTRQLNFNARNVVELMQFVEKSNHSFKVAQLSKQVAEACGIKDFPWEDVLYHDVGKIAMPQSFLFAPRYYTQVERQFIQLHVVHGCNLAKKLNLNGNIKNFALYHHERYDGSGYLKGIRGDEIPKFVQIVTICDVYD